MSALSHDEICALCESPVTNENQYASHLLARHRSYLSPQMMDAMKKKTMSVHTIAAMAKSFNPTPLPAAMGGGKAIPTRSEAAEMTAAELLEAAKAAKAAELELLKEAKATDKEIEKAAKAAEKELEKAAKASETRLEFEKIERDCYKQCMNFIKMHYVFERGGTADKHEMDRLFYEWRNNSSTHPHMTYYDLYGRRERGVLTGVIPDLMKEGKIADGGSVYCGLRRR